MEDFEQLYRLYSRQIFNYLYYLCGDRQIAEELLQETFYQAFKSIFRFKGNSKVSTWLYQIAKNIYYKHLAKVRKLKLSSFEEANELICLATPDILFEEKEKGMSIIKAINKLKEPFREILVLRSFSELSFKEIGDVLNKTEGWARTNFYRAKLKLKDILSNEEEVINGL